MSLSAAAVAELIQKHKLEGDDEELYQGAGRTCYEERMEDLADGYVYWSDWLEAVDLYTSGSATLEVEGLGMVKITRNEADCDGTVSIVFKLDDGRTFRVTGSYNSYDGHEWDNEFVEVKEYTETVVLTKYRNL